MNLLNLPALHGNWVDFLIVVFLVFFIWEGHEKGFIDLFLELIVFLASFVLALKFYPVAAQILIANFSFSRGLANAAGFFIISLAVEQLVAYLASRISEKIPVQVHKHKLNIFLSLIPLLGNVVVVIAFILTLVLSLPVQSKLKAAISESKIASSIATKTNRLEKTLSAVFGQAVLETLNFFTIAPDSSATVALHFKQNRLTNDVDSEAKMLQLVNQGREKQGLASLQWNEKLAVLARKYAQDMFEQGYFSHYDPEGKSPFDRMKGAKIDYQTAGENLALAPNVTIAHQGLMDSPGHRANILSMEFGQVGIGVIDGGIYGKMFVQEFTD